MAPEERGEDPAVPQAPPPPPDYLSPFQRDGSRVGGGLGLTADTSMHQSPPSSSSSAAGSPTHVTPPLGGGGVGPLAGAPGILPHQLSVPGAPGMPLGNHPHPLLLAQAQAAAAAAASGKPDSEIKNQILELW